MLTWLSGFVTRENALMMQADIEDKAIIGLMPIHPFWPSWIHSIWL